MKIRRRAAVLLSLAVALLAACTSTPPPRTPARFDRGSSIGVDLHLPASWWHEARLAEPLALTAEQFQKLDALRERQEEVARLDRDAMMATRELRMAIEARNALATDIVAAGAHLRALQQSLLERQIEVLAAQREILTLDQWTTLQRELMEAERPQRTEGERGGGPRRGAGPRGGGGGRRPGTF